MNNPSKHILFEIQFAMFDFKDLQSNDFRLDASAYCGSSDLKKSIMSDPRVKSLGEIARIHQPIIFGKRAMAGTPEKGIPLYSSSEMLMKDPEPAFYISRRFEDKVRSSLAITPGSVLLTRTGTVGKTLYVQDSYEGYVVDDHMIRIIPTDARYGGFIYAYLSSEVGQSLIEGLIYGAVQQVIKEYQVASMPVIVPDDDVVKRINELIVRSSRLRDNANILLQESQDSFLAYNGLPFLGNSASNDQFESMQLFSADIFGKGNFSELRLDAHFYNLAGQRAITNLRKCKSDIKTIQEVANVFMGPRFKRNYVESAHGVPFLSGKNIVQIRPELKHLSNLQMADMQELIVKRGWSLVTCSGTIGRTCFVWDNYEECAASQHILRTMPIDKEIDSAYLNAFLASRYGYEQILRFRHGSVIDEITDKQIGQVLVPCPSRKEQEAIGDMVRKAYELRAEAIRLEDEAQEILNKELKALPEGR
jgi:type I restriction enzyme S subunit